MIVETKEKIFWTVFVYEHEIPAYLELGWERTKEPDSRHPFIDGCIMRWNSEETPPVLK